MELLIDKMMAADFSTYAQSDFNRPFEEDSQVLEKVRQFGIYIVCSYCCIAQRFAQSLQKVFTVDLHGLYCKQRS